MGLDLRSDGRGGLVPSGIPGARRQPPLPKRPIGSKRRRGQFSSNSRRAPRLLSCQVLNELLADSMVLYEHYRKEHLLADPSDRDLQDLLEMYARDGAS